VGDTILMKNNRVEVVSPMHKFIFVIFFMFLKKKRIRLSFFFYLKKPIFSFKLLVYRVYGGII